ncbi:hypothetical protein J7439_14480 [Salinisphaera sp. G21_0]|nr:hypothetical protein [Salinisphaera sp. G21_0]
MYFLSSKITLMVNQWVASLSPYARVSYEQIDIGLGGTIKLHNATIDLPSGQQHRLEIQRISLRFPELYGLYQPALTGDYSLIPQSLTVELQGMNLFFLDYPHLEAHFAKRNESLNTSLPEACHDQFLFGPAQLESMGYTSANLVNLGLRYQFHDFNQTLDLVFESEIQGLGFTTLGLSIDNISHLDRAAFKTETAGLKQLSFWYQDDGYISRKVRFCAQRSGVSTAEYVAREVSRENQYYAALWGVIPGDSIREAYQDFLNNPETVSISLEFQSPFLFNRQYREDDVPVVNQRSVSINNSEIIAPILTIVPGEISKKVAELQAILLSNVELPDVDSRRANPVSEPYDDQSASLPEQEIDLRAVYVGQHIRYQPVKLTSLTEGELRQIRITLSNGRQYEGIINSLSDSELQLKSLQSGGELVLPIKLERIVQLEIKM